MHVGDTGGISLPEVIHMGYRVEYGPMGEDKKWDSGKQGGNAGLIAAFFLAFLLLVNGFWPRGREVLRQLLWPGDWAVTSAAVETFAQGLRAGDSMGTAVESFCRSVIGEAGLGQG